MAKVTFTIQGPPGAVTLHAFVTAFQHQLTILNSLDAALSGKGTPLLDWYVTDLRLGSLEASIKSGARDDEELPQHNHDQIVAQTYRNGFRVIEGEGRSPAYFDDRDLLAARQTFRLIGREGVTGFAIRTDEAELPTEITARASVNVEQLIKPGERTIGSVEGRLVAISLLGRSPRFTVFDAVTKKGVSCVFGDELLERVRMALGRRVFAHGDLLYNRRHEPKKIVLHDFRLMDDTRPPTSDELLREIDNLTGDLTTKEYLDLMRGN
jgi:hypothetical protein